MDLEKKKQVTIYLTSEQLEDLDKLRENLGDVNRSNLIRIAISAFLRNPPIPMQYINFKKMMKDMD